jgi:hypothetical protein
VIALQVILDGLSGKCSKGYSSDSSFPGLLKSPSAAEAAYLWILHGTAEVVPFSPDGSTSAVPGCAPDGLGRGSSVFGTGSIAVISQTDF